MRLRIRNVHGKLIFWPIRHFLGSWRRDTTALPTNESIFSADLLDFSLGHKT